MFWLSDLELPRDAYAGVVASHDRYREWHEAGSILGVLSRTKQGEKTDQARPGLGPVAEVCGEWDGDQEKEKGKFDRLNLRTMHVSELWW